MAKSTMIQYTCDLCGRYEMEAETEEWLIFSVELPRQDVELQVHVCTSCRGEFVREANRRASLE